MISNQILQNTIDGIKAITRREYCILDAEAKIVVTTDSDRVAGEYVPKLKPSLIHKQIVKKCKGHITLKFMMNIL